jgi:RHS repeat-associated protein
MPATYDPWGLQSVTRNDIGILRGYTGHEMLPEFGLISMNGHLYDPQIGRFLSPDNYVQEPYSSQSFNRYSYCMNNPLKYVDPDGENPIVIGAIIGAIAGAYIGGVATNDGELNPLQWNYNQLETYLGLFTGGVLGGVTGSVLGGSTLWTTSFTFSTPWATIGTSLGISTGAIGAGTKFKFNLHWTTAAGGGYDSVEEVIEKAVERAGNAFDEYVVHYHHYMDNIHTGLDVVGMIPGGDFADLANAGLYLLEGDFSNAGLSAAAMVPFFGAIATSGKNAKNAAEILSKYGSKYTNSSLKHGQEIHKMYKVNDLENDMIKEYRGVNGCRPDLVDFQNYIIYELKPYNPQGVRSGIKQLERYKRLFELKTGATWDTFIDFY